MRLICTASVVYGGKSLSAGDEFDAPPRHAQILIARRKAKKPASSLSESSLDTQHGGERLTRIEEPYVSARPVSGASYLTADQTAEDVPAKPRRTRRYRRRDQRPEEE